MKQTYAIGHLAEILCILRLWLTGWRVLARRFKQPVGEVDIIALRNPWIWSLNRARRGGASRGVWDGSPILAFIEVKARHSTRAAIESIHPAQQARIMRAASAWVSKHPQFSGHEMRFDVMVVTHWPWPIRLVDAFRM